MASDPFEALLAEADDYVRQGDWQKTFDTLTAALAHQPDHAGTYSGLGTCLIQMGQLEAALTYFEKTVELAPDSAEAYNNLGVAQALAGRYQEAEATYQKALGQDQDHVPAWKNLAQLYLQQDERMAEGVQILAAVVQSHPDEIDALLVLASCYEFGEDLPSALELYQRVAALEPGHPQATAAVKRLQALLGLPPQKDLSRIARPEHIEKLKQLKTLQRQAEGGNGTVSAPQAVRRSVAFYGPGEVSDPIRLATPARALARDQIPTKLSRAVTPEDLETYEVFVFSRPHLAPALLDGLAQVAAAGKRVIVDLDDDFHHIPADHPGYPNVGPGNPEALQILETAIGKADLLTVATPVLAERYGPLARAVEVVPNCWSQENTLWDKPAPPRSTVNIGWAGTMTHVKDVQLIRQPLLKVIRENAEACLVIGGDPAVYDLFNGLPEEKKLFLPMTIYEDYPFLLAHFDILLAPLQDQKFNQAKSDIKLLEAGIRRIPWVATPIPAYQEWALGGILADSRNEWNTALKSLIEAPERRRVLGEAGRDQANGREAAVWTSRWAEVFLG